MCGVNNSTERYLAAGTLHLICGSIGACTFTGVKEMCSDSGST
jgi:hypothetical protein